MAASPHVRGLAPRGFWHRALDFELELARPWQRILSALFFVSAAVLLRVVFLGPLGQHVPYVTLFPAVLLAAVTGGLASGLLATAVSAGVAYFWFQGGVLDHGASLAMATFVGSGAAICVVGELNLRARARLRQSRGELLRTVDRLREREESSRRYGALVESASDAIFAKSLDGRIESWNKGAEALYGYTAEEVLGRPVTILAPEDRRHEIPRLIEDVSRGLRVQNLETVRLRKDGTLVEVALQLSPIHGREGTVVSISTVARDVTERKRLEREVRLLNTELEARVVSRTAEIERANRELEAFSYSVSHDLRAPLRSVGGFARILEEDHGEKLDAEGRRCLGRIVAGAERMGLLIDDMLKLSRISRGELVKEDVDLSDLARAIADERRPDTGGRLVTVVVADGLRATADRRLLRVALGNLFDNAFKYTSKKPEARVEFGTANGNGERYFFVRDDGAGFDPAYAGKLFGAFQRLHTEAEFPGTGIGLATVQRVVQRHGGRAWAEGQVDHGATFYFTLGEGKP